MKVSRLIQLLATMPPDAEVVHLWDGEPRTTLELVWLSKGGFVVTSDYEQVCYSDDARPVDAPTPADDRYWQSSHGPELDG